ncbi:MAG: DUF262 domain-containing protein [Sphingobacteriales bacterium]|nr:DUF262 domain-containing protein [Sphingobacteriales bacterium]OJV98487.1 MAG: hypothetical protein BGO52_11930 [Sphingobacteriales bacterium 44-61]
MAIEARFSLKGSGQEIPFTIIEGENERLYLYSSHNKIEYKFPLKNDQGLFKLEVENPFDDEMGIVEERLTGLSADWIEDRSQGFDNDSDFSVKKKPGYGPAEIFVENKPFSLRQIVDLIDTKDIELTPDFQRNFIWDKTRQCRLIESILLGLPLPSIYLSQYEDGRLTVVDGLQRLSTIRAFMKDELMLINLEYLEDCNGKKFSELSQVISPLRIRKFAQTQIMCFVIDYRSPSKLKFDLFRRLNTGGKPLNNQEIRNCLSRPHVQAVLKGMVALESFGNATDWSVRDSRMDAREAALRFIYFYEQYTPDDPLGQYNGDMDNTLDDFIDELNVRLPENLNQYIGIYDNALENSYYLFGEYCFRKILPETIGTRRSPVNKLLMLSLSVLLSKHDHNTITRDFQEEGLIETLAKIIKIEPDVFEAITYGTNGKRNIELAFNSFAKLFESHRNQR